MSTSCPHDLAIKEADYSLDVLSATGLILCALDNEPAKQVFEQFYAENGCV